MKNLNFKQILLIIIIFFFLFGDFIKIKKKFNELYVYITKYFKNKQER
uniref:Sec-independent protein translocase component tatA n=1 Tax=Didymosphenia geminata TaxID=1115533 RepID=A0A1L4BMD6_9STRA|nr:Sec-independent protein translocase component tatA [Didymosphenia geminata]API83120.1 Sec-independent protein translocase component tatA [Didymosphenia geminata]